MSWSLWQWALINGSHAAASFALYWLIQSTLLILFGLATARFLARQGSAAQFVVYCTTLTAVLICPLLTWTLSFAGMTQWSLAVPLPIVAQQDIRSSRLPAETVMPEIVPQNPNRVLPSVRVPKEPESPDELASAEPLTTESDAVVAVVPPSVTPNPSTVEPPSPSRAATSFFPWMQFTTVLGSLIWLSLSVWLLARLAVAWFRLAGIRRHAVPAERMTMQICRDLSQQMGVVAPAVMHTPFLPSPCLAGLFRPAVLLPEADMTISLYDVLIHELAHLRRRDGHWNLLRKLATGLFWFQPLLWMLSRRIEMAAEEVCDDFVVEFGGDRAEYAHRLVDVAEFSAVPMATAGVAIVSLRSMLAQRVARILDTSRRLSTRTSRRLLAGTLLTGSFATLIIGFLGATPSTSAEDPTANRPVASAAGVRSQGAKRSKRAAAANRRGATAVSVSEDQVTEPANAVADAVEVPILAAKDFSGETIVAEGPRIDPKPAVTVAVRGTLPGLISTPSALPGNRRWQMYTKNSGASATDVCWSPDGRWLAIANGLIVRFFDIQEGMSEFKIVLAGHTDTVRTVRFNADSQRLASASLDGTVRIWSLDGTTTAVLRDHEAPVNAVAWNPNGKLLASGCENKTIRYWSDAGVPGPVMEAHIGPVKSLAWNFDGSQLMSCDFGIEAVNNGDEDMAHLKVWDTGGNLVHSVLINQPLSHVAWSPDGRQAVAGSWRSIWRWTVGDRQAVSRASTNLQGIVPVAWRPTGDLVAAGPMILDESGGVQSMIPLRNVSLNSAGLNAEGTILGIGRANRSFDLFNGDGEQRYHSPQLTTNNNGFAMMHAFCWSPEGKTFIPGMRYDRNLQRYDADGNKVGAVIPLPGDMRSVAWSRDGKLVATGGDQQTVSLVDLETGKAVSIGRQGHGITQVRFTPDQQQVCSAGFDGCIRFWSLDGKPLKVLEAISAPICSLAWAGDGQVMVSGHQDNTIRFWSGDGELLTVAGGHGGHVESLEFNPAGTLLASGSRDNSVRIWKSDGTPVSVLQGHSGTVYGIQWTPDGRGIYTCADDGTIRKWNAETGIAEWQALLGEAEGYVTVDAQGRVKHGDEKILESDFVFFAEDDQRRLTRTTWAEIRSALPSVASARAE